MAPSSCPRQPQDGGLRQSRPEPSSNFPGFTFLQINIRGFLSHRAELEARLALLKFPSLVGLTETFLDKSVVSPCVTGYEVVSRLDRRNGQKCGGILLLARSDVAPFVAHLGDSAVAERSWHMLHTDVGPLLIGCWYRPPSYSESASITSLESEIAGHAPDAVGVVIAGDMNIHHRPWLTYSSSATSAGRKLFDVCCSLGLSERVGQPTRGQYLLDLVLADLGDAVTCQVLPGLSDHCAILCGIRAAIPKAVVLPRRCFLYRQARWHELNRSLSSINWFGVLPLDDPSSAVAVFTGIVLEAAKTHIPFKKLHLRKSTHPWLNERCLELVASKVMAFGTPGFASKRDECSRGLLEEHKRYIARTREKINSLPTSSKKFWKLCDIMAMKTVGVSSIPPLRSSSSAWVVLPEKKAELFSATFASKSALPVHRENEFSGLVTVADSPAMSGFLPIRLRHVSKILKGLDASSGTGPDALPTRILKGCASALALPIALLIRSALNAGVWPDAWKAHWIFPLHKKKSKAEAKNYRGIHLTPQLSKVAERCLAVHLQPFLENSIAFGPNQFAYMKGRGAKDALALNVVRWITWLGEGCRIGLYCSDVSGAFDRVPSQRLMAKLRSKGVHKLLLDVLDSWLRDRSAVVVVDGALSAPAPLRNSVYQGTVLGPPLWNCYYEDARRAILQHGFLETIFADDLNAYKRFSSQMSDDQIDSQLKECQRSLHNWGQANQVCFDPSKESFHTLDRRKPSGGNFQMLGVTFDPKLVMDSACHEVAGQAHCRLRSLLRSRNVFSLENLVRHYKSQILSYVEFATPAVYHAPAYFLSQIDRVQDTFLGEVGLTAATALTVFNLAPLSTRRDIAMSGLLFRIAHGKAPPQFQSLIHRVEALPFPRNLRNPSTQHSLQFYDPVDGSESKMLARSVFGLIYAFNMLPAHVVESSSVSIFQRRLQDAVKRAQAQDIPEWEAVLRAGVRRLSLKAYQGLFV